MSSSRNFPGGNSYMRQASYENQPSGPSVLPPPLKKASGSRPTPPSSSNNNNSNNNNNNNNNFNNSSVNRNQTVRGVVRGTVRDKEANRLAGVPSRSLTRGKTLTRPDRYVAPAPLINPGNLPGTGAVSTKLVNGVPTLRLKSSFWSVWGIFVTVITFWAPSFLLSACGLAEVKHRAWKEKVALCSIALMMGGAVGFVTIGLTRTLCPVAGEKSSSSFIRLGSTTGYVGYEGWNYQVGDKTPVMFGTVANTLPGYDVSYLFDRTAFVYPACAGITAKYATTNLCTNSNSTGPVKCMLGAPTPALFTTLSLANSTRQVGYDWGQIPQFENYMVIDGNVLNLTPYMLANPIAIPNDPVDTAIRYMLRTMVRAGGKDATRIFYNRIELESSVKCLVAKYYAGHIDKITPGCFVSQLFLYVSLALIMTIVMVRFFMAVTFKWILSHKLVVAPKNLKRHVISPAVMPEGANIDVGNTTGAAPWTNQRNGSDSRAVLRKASALGPFNDGGDFTEKSRGRREPVGVDGMINMATIGAELFCVCLITCYSEGLESIKTTIDSVTGATYSDDRKLLFIVCDGMITGSGEKMSTPDICVGLIEADERFGEPQAMSYVSIGSGTKAHNQAMIYAGHYNHVKGHRTPAIVIVKCGAPLESRDSKPGNRGKRDSQMILMNFFSRVTYNDRMSPLDYDLFRKMQSLMGVTPDFFEVVLMVDADTKIAKDSMGFLVRALQNDSMIMGICGETRIANKRQSWVTSIQVFEYYISHHLAKAFESVFGGVTCLPGCFSMYRLKARKLNDGDWFPVLVQPTIISEYSQSVVTTLHQKNLLLLGEDRFLTTLLLRTFPNRKMMFCPQARCRTVVPDTFGVLLSQRRRWINSTVHNLMELVLVRNLCGCFCFSQQFVTVVDLIGTVVLPVAILLTYTLIINYIFNPPASFSDAIPLLLLGAVLGLPAVLILITSFKVVYIGWMVIYLIALPIWNFVLPVYAFSKFDDFSWGETRKVQGAVKGDDDHDKNTGIAVEVPLRRWEDWERSRLRKIKRDEKRRKEFEKNFGSRHFFGGAGSTYEDSVGHSDSSSMFSHDDDRWGQQIGAYYEDGPSAAPPPVGLYSVDETSDDHETIETSAMEMALEQGWAEEDTYAPTGFGSEYGRTGTPQSAFSQSNQHATRYELNDDGPLYPPSTQHLLPSSSRSSLTSDFTSTSTSGYPIIPSLYSSESRLPLTSPTFMTPGGGTSSSGMDRPFGGNHTRQRSYPSPEGDARKTPSPTSNSRKGSESQDIAFGQSYAR